MSKRNFILLIIVLVIAVIAVYGFLYFKNNNTGGEDTGTGINFLSQFNPFNSKPPTKPNTPGGTDIPNTEPGTNNTETENSIAKLKKVSSISVAGFGLFMKERLKEVPVPIPPATTVDGTPATPPAKTNTKPTPPPTELALAIRYVDRATGNIFQTFADKIEERKFSQTVIPKVYDAYFGKNAESVVMRHLKTNERTIETFLGTLPKEKLGEDIESNEIKGTFLNDNIKDISISPDATKMFYLFNSVAASGESAIGTILNFADSKKIQIFSSPFTEWLSLWATPKTITLTTKPAGVVAGYMYTIDVDKKNLVKMLGGINGLTTSTSPNGKLVLYANNNLSLSLYHTDTKISEAVEINTLPEKCVWNKTSEFVYCAVPQDPTAGSYPDDWYKGEVTFSDQIWRINVQDGTANILADLSAAAGEDIDGIKLAVDSGENYLFFVNKKDSILWELALR